MVIITNIVFLSILIGGWICLYFINAIYGVGACIAAAVVFILVMHYVRKTTIRIVDMLEKKNVDSMEVEPLNITDNTEEYRDNIMDIYQPIEAEDSKAELKAKE